MWVGSAMAATLSVGPGQPFGTVQAAVNASAPRDVIEIHAGVYVEDVTVSHELDLVGVGWPELRAATPGFFGATLTTSAHLRLEGLVLRDGGSYACVNVLGGGVAPDLVVVATRFLGCRVGINDASTAGGLHVRAGVFVGNGTAVSGGGTVTIRGSTFEGNDVAVSVADDATITDNVFVRNGQGVLLYDLDDQVVARNVFCGNGPDGALTGVVAYVAGSPVAQIRNNRFYENRGAVGGAVTLDSGGYGTLAGLELRGNTFVGNDGSRASHVALEDVDAVVENNVFAAGGAAGRAVTLRSTHAYGFQPSSLVGDWNLFWSNAGGDLGAGLSAADFGAATLWGVDPAFTSWVADGRCGDDLTLLPGSPAIDAGDPAWPDPDGTARDIGWISHR
jgi:hypothetical protein